MNTARLLFLSVVVWHAAGRAGEGEKAATGVVTTRADAAGVLLKGWFEEGSAAGHSGDFYDNRDGGHSRLDLSRYPQLTALSYTDAQIQAKANHGPAREIRPETVIGNASLSGPAVGGASIPRLLYSTREGMAFLNGQYRGNQIYIYPEHQDHDPAGEGSSGHGDLFSVNTPALIISQGSSGSDQPFLDALAMTLASFRPEVKELLRSQKLLGPVTQQILRSSLRTVVRREDYLTVAAHPSAFSAEWLDEEKMMRAARALTPDTFPPVFHLEVVREQAPPRAGIDYFEAPGQEREALADRGMAIARVFRGMARDREITIRATGFRNTPGRPLQIHWRLLRGDPALVSIERSDSAPEATIRVTWDAKGFDVPGPSGMTSRRVEIGVFADDGVNYSPPCFVTFYCLPNERREYDGEGRIVRTDYRFEGAFVDVTLTSDKRWIDHYRYDPATGDLSGWRREEEGREPVEFDVSGRRIGPEGTVGIRYEVDVPTRRLLQIVRD